MATQPMVEEVDTTAAEAAPVDVEQPPADQTTEDSLYPDDERVEPAEGDGDQGDDQPDDQPDPEPIAAPVSWAKDAKDVFAKLPREAQEVIATRERDREAFVQTKAREAASTRQAVEQEARTVLLTMAKNQANELDRYAKMFDMPQPDVALLQSDNPEDHRLYMMQERDYKLVSAQRDQAQRDAEAARQHAQTLEHQATQAELEREQQILTEQLPEWSEPSRRAELVSTFRSTAAELGYAPELIEQARACDIIAVQKVASWKADAEKYRGLMKQKMVPVRAAKAIPPSARPAAPGGQRAPVSTAELLYPNDVRR